MVLVTLPLFKSPGSESWISWNLHPFFSGSISHYSFKILSICHPSYLPGCINMTFLKHSFSSVKQRLLLYTLLVETTWVLERGKQIQICGPPCISYGLRNVTTYILSWFPRPMIQMMCLLHKTLLKNKGKIPHKEESNKCIMSIKYSSLSLWSWN